MSRPLRIEFPGAVYHVTSRGDRREPIFVDDTDRAALLNVLGQGMQRFDAQVLAYCLMGNHYHFVLQTHQANLSLLMRHLNGVYTQAFNRRHGKVGHLFQGRFKAILVDRDAYLLEVCRYVELNPVRAGMVAAPGDWPWSSYRAHVGALGDQPGPPWLDTAGLHGYLLQQPATSAADHRRAGQQYAALVAQGLGVALWDDGLRQQIYLGDEDFVDRMQALAEPPRKTTRDTPRPQRLAPRPLAHWLGVSASREEALYRAHTEGGLTMTALAAELGLSVSRVSRLIARAEAVTAEAGTAPAGKRRAT
jgi:putative transposase